MTRLNREIRASAGVFSGNGQSFSMQFSFGPDFIGFEGHFPGKPILPAMVQLMTGAVACGQAAEKRLVARKVGRAKFLKPVLPGDPVEVHGTLNETENGYIAAIRILNGSDLAASFQMELAEAREAL
ncbi:hypothetical protein [Salidesulfovibrio onnuriiensis]|uniref:hypothetical protein n=1 Tax=Salidesulfovibrio onnuriiensis TaxID=2583823 RepID=UPI0011C7B785|nr:hypothetical protein [Salidesulfovibrio onnuriiensis]